jgi:hypothetical protein
MAAFLPNALYVGLGELVICYGLGLPLLYILEHVLQKNSHLKTLFPQN